MLGDLAGGGFESLAHNVSVDGSFVVGHSESADGLEAFLWSVATGMQGLGDLSGGGFFSTAYDVSADGGVVVGEGESALGREAFVWTVDGGLESLADYLGRNGLTISGWRFEAAYGVSADGRTIAGFGTNPEGWREAFVVVVPEPGTAMLLGLGLAALGARRHLFGAISAR